MAILFYQLHIVFQTQNYMYMKTLKVKNLMQKQKLSLEDALGKLEETIAKLQSEEVSLEESFNLYKEGMDYVKLCSETIDQVEKKVLMLNQEGKLDELGD